MSKRTKIPLIFILILLLFISLVAAAYPILSSWYSEKHNSELMVEYEEFIDNTDDESINAALAAAHSYNRNLANGVFSCQDFEANGYYDLLNITGNNIIGFLEIPAIGVSLTIYHGTSSDVLTKGVGHMEQTSLPIGGESTHAVLSAHTGSTNQKLFTDLVLLKTGDIFYITVLGQKLAYQVDQIKSVLPEEISDIQVVEGADYVTLSTCTPYGINTHRLLVRGHRINLEEATEIEILEEDDGENTASGSIWMQKYISGILFGLGLAFFSIILVFLAVLLYRKNRKKDAARFS